MIFGEFSVSISNDIGFIKDQGSFAMEKFDALDQDTQKEVAQRIAQFVLNMIEGIQKICSERDELNLATESKLPAVLPHQRIKLGTSDLVAILRLQCDRLLVTQDREFMRLVEEDHKGLKSAISKETVLRQIFEEHDYHRSFSEGCKSAKTHFSAFDGLQWWTCNCFSRYYSG